jgi:hypothetical protein
LLHVIGSSFAPMRATPTNCTRLPGLPVDPDGRRNHQHLYRLPVPLAWRKAYSSNPAGEWANSVIRNLSRPITLSSNSTQHELCDEFGTGSKPQERQAIWTLKPRRTALKASLKAAEL